MWNVIPSVVRRDRLPFVQIITRKELNKRMFSSAGTRKLYMMQLGDNT